jgi:hypothetical protein
MKVLFLSQGQRIEDHPGWNYSLDQLKKEGFITDFFNIPYKGYVAQNGWQAFYCHVVELCRQDLFDIVLFHHFHGNIHAISPRLCIKLLQALPHKPIILTSCGDGFSDNWLAPHYPEDFKECSRAADITFSSQMGKAADIMRRWGAKNIVLSPLSMCPARFQAQHINPMAHSFDFDVVSVGSRNVGRIPNPFNRNTYAVRIREKVMNALSKRYGSRFGLFGHGWKGLVSNQGPIPFDQQQKTYRRGRVVVGGTPYSISDYYASNRPFFSIASGVPTIELAVPRLDHILRDQEHCYFCHSIDEVIAQCDHLLKSDPVELYAKAALAADYIAERHTQYHRLKFQLETAIRHRQNGNRLDVAFPFFLPEVDLMNEMKYATR